jgi:hypothetical protein
MHDMADQCVRIETVAVPGRHAAAACHFAAGPQQLDEQCQQRRDPLQVDAAVLWIVVSSGLAQDLRWNGMDRLRQKWSWIPGTDGGENSLPLHVDGRMHVAKMQCRAKTPCPCRAGRC